MNRGTGQKDTTAMDPIGSALRDVMNKLHPAITAGAAINTSGDVRSMIKQAQDYEEKHSRASILFKELSGMTLAEFCAGGGSLEDALKIMSGTITLREVEGIGNEIIEQLQRQTEKEAADAMRRAAGGPAGSGGGYHGPTAKA